MSKKRWTEEQGYEVVRQWRRSGLSMSAFARSRGYNPMRVQYWRERAEAAAAAPAASAMKLVPGVVVGLGTSIGVSVSLPRGVVVEARAVVEIPATWLAEVVRALESSR